MSKLSVGLLYWNGFVCLSLFLFVGMDNNSVGNLEMVTEAGWYILGENQQHVGPYAFSELRGELWELNKTYLYIVANWYCSKHHLWFLLFVGEIDE